MPLEDDELFKDRAPRAPRGKDRHERVPYHELADEERRAAWAELRAAQATRARKGRAVPLYWALASAAAFAAGALLSAAGYGGVAKAANWIGVVLVAFVLVAIGRGLFGRHAGTKDDFAPPGF